MSHHKQPQLNGAYYGPSIPPPNSSYRPAHTSGGRSCCGRFGCCLLKILCSILIAIAILVLIFWLIVRPYEPKFYASDASLSAFNYSGNQLSYNLAVNLTIRNPNRRLGIYYDAFEANAFYQDQRFAMKEVDPFFQGTKNTTAIGPVAFNGKRAISLESSSDYESQRSDGNFNIVVRLHLKVRFKLGAFKTGKWKPKVKCDLSVPLTTSLSAAKFETTRCHYYF